MSNRDYDYNSNICKVKRVQFSLLSPEEIKGQATCKITDHTLYTSSENGSHPCAGGHQCRDPSSSSSGKKRHASGPHDFLLLHAYSFSFEDTAWRVPEDH